MKRSRTRNVVSVLLGGLALALAIYPAAAAAGDDPGVKDAWERLQEAGSYRFLSSIEQTLVPRPLPEMIGEQEQRLHLVVEARLNKQ